MAEPLPLPALLSQALVAFTIEFDNEFEHQTPHRTTNHGSTPGSTNAPWLVSMAMWIRFMRFVPDDGIAIPDLQRRGALNGKQAKVWLTRMGKWWGYIAVDRSASDNPLDWIVRPTAGGRKALRVWRPLAGIIEERWEKRFGKDIIAEVRQSLQLLVRQLNPNLPDYLPILGYEMLSEGPESDPPSPDATALPAEVALPILLAKVLLAFALEFERESGQSLAIAANVLRLAGEEGIRVQDLPFLSGVSREAIAISVKRLEKRGFAVVHSERTAGQRYSFSRLRERTRATYIAR